MFRTVLCFGFGIIGMIGLTPVGILACIFSFTPLRRQAAWYMSKVARGWALVLIFLTGTKLTARGLENRKISGPVCFMSNHSGLFDIVLLLAYSGRPFGFIAKRELAYIPFLNAWILVLGGLFINRRNVRQGIKTINKGIRRIKEGEAMLIFPEGTRSRGRGLLPFKDGSFKLAIESGCHIIPVAITGSYELVERNGKVVTCPTKISFGTVVNAAAYTSKKELSECVYNEIKKMLDSQNANK